MAAGILKSIATSFAGTVHSAMGLFIPILRAQLGGHQKNCVLLILLFSLLGQSLS